MGTGPSTLRLFESMSVGSIPVVFNNIKLPQEIKNLVKIMDVNDLIKNPYILDELAENGNSISKNIYEIYWETLSNENLHKSIIIALNGN